MRLVPDECGGAACLALGGEGDCLDLRWGACGADLEMIVACLGVDCVLAVLGVAVLVVVGGVGSRVRLGLGRTEGGHLGLGLERIAALSDGVR